MPHVDGQIVQVISVSGGGVELVVGEHSGIFASTGVMKIFLDGQACLDFYKAVTGRKWSKTGGGPGVFAVMMRKALSGKKVVINFPWL